MRQHQIELNPDVVTYIERLFYEYETLKDNVSYMVQHFKFDKAFLESDLFRKYQQNEMNAKMNYERGMQEVYEKYLPEKYKRHRINWSVDFRRRQLIIDQFCDCEV